MEGKKSMKNQIGQVKINVYEENKNISVEVEGFPDDSDVTIKILAAANEAVMKHFIAKAKDETENSKKMAKK